MEYPTTKLFIIFILATAWFAATAYSDNGKDNKGDHGHPVTAPVHPPIHPPAHPPKHHQHHDHHPPHHPPPAPPPEHHHLPFRRSLVAVEGAVFCQSCKYAGKDDFSGATPIKDAVVKLECRNTAKLTTLTAKTDAQGYFYIQTHNVTTYGYDKCRAFLVSSPLTTCDKPTNVLDGLTGAKLNWYRPFYLFKVPYELFTTGPFAFLPKCG